MTYSSEVLADSPLAYYRMGDASGTTMTDSSGNSRNGTYSVHLSLAATGLLYGDADTAVEWTGASGSMATVADATWQDTGTALTIEAWIHADSLSGAYRFIASKNNNGTNNSSSAWWFSVKAGKLNVGLWVTSALEVDGATTLVAGNTYHVAAVYNGTDVRLYVNGVLDNTPTAMTGSIRAGDQPIRIGNWGSNSLIFDGRIDEFAFYGTALSSTRIADHYAAGIPPAAITGTFDVDLPVPAASFTGSYTPPAQTGTFDVDLPVPVASFAGSYAAPPTGTFAVDLPVPVADFTGSYTAPPNPSSVFDAVLPVPTVAFTGAYIAPESGTFAVDLPVPVASFAGTYTPAPISGSFAVVLPLPTVEFTGLVDGLEGTFAAVLPLPTVSFTGTYGGPYPTDTSNDLGGISLEGSGVATVTRPVAAPPASLVLATRVDKAAAYPTPTMVNGRPT